MSLIIKIWRWIKRIIYPLDIDNVFMRVPTKVK